MSIWAKLGFVGEMASVETNKGMDALMKMLVRFDPAGASEAEISQIEKALAEFCLKTEEARQRMVKLEEQDKSLHEANKKKMQLAETWQTEIDNPETAAERKTQLEGALTKLVSELEEEVSTMAQKDEEVKIARETFETFDQVVKETNEKLRTRVKNKEKAVAGLELAKTKEELANDKIDAARVLAGIRKASDSFSASDVINEQAKAAETRTAAKLREADLLNGHKAEDDFVKTEMAKLDGSDKSQLSLKDRLAALQK